MIGNDKRYEHSGTTGNDTTRGSHGKRCPACGSESIRVFPMPGTSLVRYACDGCGKSYLTSMSF